MLQSFFSWQTFWAVSAGRTSAYDGPVPSRVPVRPEPVSRYTQQQAHETTAPLSGTSSLLMIKHTCVFSAITCKKRLLWKMPFPPMMSCVCLHAVSQQQQQQQLLMYSTVHSPVWPQCFITAALTHISPLYRPSYLSSVSFILFPPKHWDRSVVAG